MASLTNHPNCSHRPFHGQSPRQGRYPGLARGLARVLAIAGLALAAPLTLAADAMAGMTMGGKAELGSSAAFAPDGQLVVVTKQGEHLVLYRSPNEGRTWTAPTLVNAQPEPISADGENRPKLAFTPDGGTLVAWTHPLAKPYTGQIRLARSDNGRDFAAPLTVHRDTAEITHRFESLVVAPDGRVIVAWIDKRDMETAKAGKTAYRGAAIYSAVSSDGGRSFQAERKVADHSCECCRIGLAWDRDGAPLALWRQFFGRNTRDFALARLPLAPDQAPDAPQRASDDNWAIDACPHHGGDLAVDAGGRYHLLWFTLGSTRQGLFYRHSDDGGRSFSIPLPIGDPERQAGHPALLLVGKRVSIIWRDFAGDRFRLLVMTSNDGGDHWQPARVLAEAAGPADYPRPLATPQGGLVLWQTAQGLQVLPLDSGEVR